MVKVNSCKKIIKELIVHEEDILYVFVKTVKISLC